MSKPIQELIQLDECFQILQALQVSLKNALSGSESPERIPELVEARKVQLEKLQSLDIQIEKVMQTLSPEQSEQVKNSLMDFGKRFELLAVNEQDILRALEAQSPKETPSHDKKPPKAPPGGSLDVSQ